MTRNYSKVPDEKRQLLIDMIKQNMTIKDAARLVEIKYENAKAIYRVYRREQRTDKRKNRFRSKGANNSMDSEQSSKKGKRKKRMSLIKLHQETINDSQMEDNDEEHNDEVEGDFAMQESGDEQQAKSCFVVKKNSRTSQRPGLRPIQEAVQIPSWKKISMQEQPKTNVQKVIQKTRGKKSTDHICKTETQQDKDELGHRRASNQSPPVKRKLQSINSLQQDFQSSMPMPQNKVVVSMVNNLPPEPIKYGQKFFQTLNNGVKNGSAAQSKAQFLKAVTEQQNSDQPSAPVLSPCLQEHNNARLNQGVNSDGAIGVAVPIGQHVVETGAKSKMQNQEKVRTPHRLSENPRANMGGISGQPPNSDTATQNNNAVPNLILQKNIETQQLSQIYGDLPTQQLDQMQNSFLIGNHQEGSGSKLRLSQQLGGNNDMIQYWQMSANQKGDDITNALQTGHFQTNAQGANLMLSQEMQDFRQRTLVNDMVSRNNTNTNAISNLRTPMPVQRKRSTAGVIQQTTTTPATQKLTQSMSMFPASSAPGLPPTHQFSAMVPGQSDVQHVQTQQYHQPLNSTTQLQQQQNQARQIGAQYNRPSQTKNHSIADQAVVEEEKFDSKTVRNTVGIINSMYPHQNNWMVPPALNMQPSGGLLAASRVSTEFKDPAAMVNHQFSHSGKTFAEAVQAAHHQNAQPQHQHPFTLSRQISQNQAHHQGQQHLQHQGGMLSSGSIMNLGIPHQQQTNVNDFVGMMNYSPVLNRRSSMQQNQNHLNFGPGGIDNSGLVNPIHNNTCSRGPNLFEPVSAELSREPMQQHTSPMKRPSIIHSVTGLVKFIEQPQLASAGKLAQVMNSENQFEEKKDHCRQINNEFEHKSDAIQQLQAKVMEEMPLQQQTSFADQESQRQSISVAEQAQLQPQKSPSQTSGQNDKANAYQRNLNQDQFELMNNDPITDEQQPKLPYLGLQINNHEKPKQLSLRHVQQGVLTQVNEGKIVKIPQATFQQQALASYQVKNKTERHSEKLRQLSGMLKSLKTNMVISDHFQQDKHGLQSVPPSSKDNNSQAALAFYELQRSPKAEAGKDVTKAIAERANTDKVKEALNAAMDGDDDKAAGKDELLAENTVKAGEKEESQLGEFYAVTTHKKKERGEVKITANAEGENIFHTEQRFLFPQNNHKDAPKSKASAGVEKKGDSCEAEVKDEPHIDVGEASSILQQSSINENNRKQSELMEIDESSDGSSSSVSAASDAHQEMGDDNAHQTQHMQPDQIEQPKRKIKQQQVHNNNKLVAELSQDKSQTINPQLGTIHQSQQLQQPRQLTNTSQAVEAVRLPPMQQVALYQQMQQPLQNTVLQAPQVRISQQQQQPQPFSMRPMAPLAPQMIVKPAEWPFITQTNIMPVEMAAQRQQQEMSRYLLNGIEQMQIKLKYLGYASEKAGIAQSQASAGSSRQQMEKAFSTIDNFSGEVLALHKSLQKLRGSSIPGAQETIENNQKMLCSLTAIIELLQVELRRAKVDQAATNPFAMQMPQNNGQNNLSSTSFVPQAPPQSANMQRRLSTISVPQQQALFVANNRTCNTNLFQTPSMIAGGGLSQRFQPQPIAMLASPNGIIGDISLAVQPKSSSNETIQQQLKRSSQQVLQLQQTLLTVGGIRDFSPLSQAQVSPLQQPGTTIQQQQTHLAQLQQPLQQQQQLYFWPQNQLPSRSQQ